MRMKTPQIPISNNGKQGNSTEILHLTRSKISNISTQFKVCFALEAKKKMER